MLKVKKRLGSGVTDVCKPGDEGIEYISLSIFRTDGKKSYSEETGDFEVGLIVMGGDVDVLAQDVEMKGVGGRPNVFAGPAAAVFVPSGSTFEIKGAGLPAEVAIARVKAAGEGEMRLITPQDVKIKSVGAHNWQRYVHDIIDQRIPASRMVLGETFNPPGNWSSFPPHRHDEDRLPEEVNMEEVYHFRMMPQQGFGFQRIYNDDHSLDETHLLEDTDTVLIPEGYHPVAAAPGYQLYYLWILAGESRLLCPFDDPNHKWMKGTEAVVKSLR